jgi:glycine cleavage system H protein
VNGDPMGGGWFFKIELDDVEDFEKLMDEAAYNAFLETL